MRGDDTDRLISCRDHILEALTKAMGHRGKRIKWVEHERLTVTVAANEWALAHKGVNITVDDVERVEQRAVGHADYAQKLTLYVAEMVCGLT